MIKRVRSLVYRQPHGRFNIFWHSQQFTKPALSVYLLRFKNPRHDNVELKLSHTILLKCRWYVHWGWVLAAENWGKKNHSHHVGRAGLLSVLGVGEHSHFIKSTPRATIQTHEIKYQKLFSCGMCGVEFGVFVESCWLSFFKRPLNTNKWATLNK